MLSPQFNEIVEEQLKLCTSILCSKAKEYAADNDRLHNFKSAAGLTGETPIQALYGMMLKHVVSVMDMCKSGENYNLQLWNEKITDNINYLLLLKALVVEDMSQRTVCGNDTKN